MVKGKDLDTKPKIDSNMILIVTTLYEKNGQVLMKDKDSILIKIWCYQAQIEINKIPIKDNFQIGFGEIITLTQNLITI